MSRTRTTSGRLLSRRHRSFAPSERSKPAALGERGVISMRYRKRGSAMVHSATLVIRLVDDLILSEDAASAGSPRTLRYIPGAAMLGLAASQLYDSLGNDAFRVFHSGEVRFHNAYPAL